ncbi:hypothetical protein LCGC14_1469440 [marine sediment metagenome]|uniref:Uncharacterized protein n=1 Tax=marine sediment metagenome TaxID=412755 RepID=A0A0F9JDD5_9ZZZZ
MASGDTLAKFLPQSNEPPANFARIDSRIGTTHPVLDFALTEETIFSDVLPRNYAGGGITAYLHYAMTSAVANDIKLETSLERIGDQQQDLDADGFAAAQNTGDITVPGTSGLVDIITSTHTDGAQMDSIAVGEGFRLKVKRVAVVGTDASGDLELRFVEIKEN